MNILHFAAYLHCSPVAIAAVVATLGGGWWTGCGGWWTGCGGWWTGCDGWWTGCRGWRTGCRVLELSSGQSTEYCPGPGDCKYY